MGGDIKMGKGKRFVRNLDDNILIIEQKISVYKDLTKFLELTTKMKGFNENIFFGEFISPHHRGVSRALGFLFAKPGAAPKMIPAPTVPQKPL